MARLIPFDQLPHLHSTRDTRDRLDLVTDNVKLGAQLIRADRIIYHPGDTAAKHYHTNCHHLFYVLYGNGILHVDDGDYRLHPGMVAVVAPSEVHWFECTGSKMTPRKTLLLSSSGARRPKRQSGSRTIYELGNSIPEFQAIIKMSSVRKVCHSERPQGVKNPRRFEPRRLKSAGDPSLCSG
jgi:quercetin dioxygenase-like cupin family protein